MVAPADPTARTLAYTHGHADGTLDARAGYAPDPAILHPDSAPRWRRARARPAGLDIRAAGYRAGYAAVSASTPSASTPRTSHNGPSSEWPVTSAADHVS